MTYNFVIIDLMNIKFKAMENEVEELKKDKEVRENE